MDRGCGYTETRQYNLNRRLTRQTAGTGLGMDLTYNYAAANGRVASVMDNLSGEQIAYTYDQLNRLTQAMTNNAWGLSFGYDGFGNLTQQTRVQGTTGPSMSVTVDPGTNRITTAGYGYDANGNVTQTPDGMTYGYDVANRMVSNNAVYNPKNQRVFEGAYLGDPAAGARAMGDDGPVGVGES
jgi:YD repeat-containing protein